MATIGEALATALEHHRAGRLDAAEEVYRRVLAADPNQPDAWHLLGVVAYQAGRHAEAVECLGRAIALNPSAAVYHLDLANCLKDVGRLAEAIASYAKAVELNPQSAEANYGLGVALQAGRRLQEAMVYYERAVQVQPDCVEAHNNLANVLVCLGRVAEAIPYYRRALELRPDAFPVYNNLGAALRANRRLADAVACFRRALELKPDFADAESNLGTALKDQGQLEEAVACFRRAIELRPNFPEAHNNLVYTLIFCPGYDAAAIYEEHRRWNERYAEPLAKLIEPHGNDRSADRRLRIGYVSPDFRSHVIGCNLLPLFREHDHQRFEVVCYADLYRPDELSRRFQGYADVWRDTTRMTDAQLAQCVRDDRIDVLVDLALHGKGNRLLVFARKPAPVQATFAGYPGTTGLTAIDYRITDRYLDPPEMFDRFYCEKSIRLPDSFWCYDAVAGDPEPSALPAAEKGCVTFGCLNNFCKVNAPVLRLWARVLRAVEGSRLVLLAGEGTHRQRTVDLLATEGIASDRVTFVGYLPRQQYLGLYHDIDVSLDTLPYNGHTTSLDSLWMGVPVVTLVGTTVVGRAGLCQLMNLNLPELVAYDPEQYVRIAADLAHDRPRLAALRRELRERMRSAPLMDAKRFARNIEAAYRTMWEPWRAGGADILVRQ